MKLKNSIMKILLSLILSLILNAVCVFAQNGNLSYLADPYDNNKYHIKDSYNQTVGYLILNQYNQDEASVYDANMRFVKKISFGNSNNTSIYDPGVGQGQNIQINTANFSIDPSSIQPINGDEFMRGVNLANQRAERRKQQNLREADIAAKYILMGYDSINSGNYKSAISYANMVDENKHPHLKCDKYTLLATTLIILKNSSYKRYYNLVRASCTSDVTSLLDNLISEMK